MDAKISEERFNELSEDFQKEYKKLDDGNYQLNVVSVDGLALENVDGLKKTLGKVRTELQTANAKVQGFGELTPEQALSAVKKVEEFANFDPDKQVEEKIKAREEKILNRHKEEISKYEENTGKLKSQLQKLTVDNVISSALVEAGAKESKVLPSYIKGRVKMKEDADGTIRTVVLDEDGNEAIGDSQGNPMTVKQFVGELSQDPMYSPFFNGTGASGTGSSGGSDNSSGGSGRRAGGSKRQIKASDIDSISKYADEIGKGEAVVVDD